MSEPKLKIEGLNKWYGGRKSTVHALSNIDLELADNEFVSLVGASGCGKSTLLSIVAGLQGFDNGVLLTDGAPIVGPGLDRGVVFQSYTLLPWLTAQQNVEFALQAGRGGLERQSLIDREFGAGVVAHGSSFLLGGMQSWGEVVDAPA